MTDKVITIAGGGDFSKMPQQTTMPEIHVEVIQPPPDNSLLIATGIVVPVIIAIFGWWLTHRKKEHPNAGHAVSPNSYAKTDAEK